MNKKIVKKSLLSITTCAFITASIMTFAAAWGKPVGSFYWVITFSLWGLGISLLVFVSWLDNKGY